MKKTRFLIIFLLIFVLIGFTSCDQNPTQDPENPDNPPHIVTNLETPTNLNVDITNELVTVTFDKVQNAIMYEVVFTNANTKEEIKEKLSPDFNSVIKKISFFNNGAYTVKVRSLGDNGETYYNSAFSKAISFTISSGTVTPDPLIKLDSPKNLNIKNESDSILVSYSKVLNASGYQIIIKDASGNVTLTKETDGISYNINVMSFKDGEYYINVISIGDDVKYSSSDESENVSFKVKDGKPDTGIEEPPVELMAYYKQAEGLIGNALKTQLRTIITSTHKKITTYADCKTYLQNADEDPKNSSNMLLYYTGESVKKSNNMSIWNREHVWAQSLGWFTTSQAGADLHHIRPCDPSVNSSRGNKKFGTGSGYYYPYNVNGSGQDYRGDTARIIFYLFTRYSQSDSYSFTSIAQSLDILLEWNRIDPVNAHEEHRNEYIYSIQGNRNPFIDYPEFADEIWG